MKKRKAPVLSGFENIKSKIKAWRGYKYGLFYGQEFISIEVGGGSSSLDELIAQDAIDEARTAKLMKECKLDYLAIEHEDLCYNLNLMRVSITLIADDDGRSVGPEHFRSPLLDARMASANIAFILAWAAEPIFYGMAAMSVAFWSKNILFVETRINHEQQWIDHINAVNPSIQFVIAAPVGGNV